MPENFGKRLPMDLRMVEEIRRSPANSAENVGMLEDWGGTVAYKEMARWPVEQRMAFFAVQEGYTTEADIAAATGLKTSDISRALTALQGKGVVQTGVITK